LKPLLFGEKTMKDQKFILCHKCLGVLSGETKDTPLQHCRCISGWIRGWEESVSFAQATSSNTYGKKMD